MGEAGLKRLRRRRKSLAPDQHKAERLAWTTRVLAHADRILRRRAYTDGIVFYVARASVETQDKARAALGSQVWR